MEILKYLLGAIYIFVCIIIIILTLMQKKGQEGLSGAIVGTATAGVGNFYEKNKGRTKEGALKKWTVIMGIIFAVLTLILGILFVVK